jgi:dienelactone hydrolase
MRASLRAASAAILLSFILSGFAAAQTASSKQVAARVELHSIPSLTLSDQQFLNGDANAKPVNVTGEFRIAQGSGRLPVMVLIHGSGGIGANIEPWTQQFNAMGISTFLINGFTGRGLTSVNTDQASLGRLNFILDIYRSLDILAKHPRADPKRIALMGFSRGGQAALYASLARFNKMWNKSGLQFAAYIPFYPDCSTTYSGETDVAGRPIRIFHGMPDDYNPVAKCKAYVERLRDANHDVALTEYPDA